MSRIPPLDRDSVSPDFQPFFDREIAVYGQPLNSTRIAAYRPSIAAAARALGQAVAEAGLVPAQLRFLINVRVASMVGCPFWADINAVGGSEAGASPEKIEALAEFRSSDLFSPAEKVALELAEAATGLPHDVSDELFERLRQYYSDPEIVELSYVVALENFRSRFNRTLRIESQGLYCVLPSGGGPDQVKGS